MRNHRTKQENVMTEYVLAGKDPEGFAVKHIDKEKGRGVFAQHDFLRGDFLMEYRGRLTKFDPGFGPYIFEFDCKSSRYWIDASKEDGTLGRLINDSTDGNATAKVVEIRGIPRIGIFAVRDIKTGQEITYSYNKGEKVNYPWREKTRVATPPLLQEEQDEHGSDPDYEPQSESSDEDERKQVKLKKAVVLLEKLKSCPGKSASLVSNPVKGKCPSNVPLSPSSPSSPPSPLPPQSSPDSPSPFHSSPSAPDPAPKAREEPRKSIKRPRVNERAQTSAKRQRCTCPICKLDVVHLPRHLRVAHEYDRNTSLAVSKTEKKIKRLKCCPIKTCASVTNRLDTHLVRVHGMYRGPELHRLVLSTRMRNIELVVFYVDLD